MNIDQLLIDKKLRPTKARIAVLNVLAQTNSALSHSEILDKLPPQKEFDRVTIYRVLDWLTKYQLIHKISAGNRAWKFQLTSPPLQKIVSASKKTSLFANPSHAHAHLLCRQCGSVTCVHEVAPKFTQQVLDKYHVESIDIHFKGLCLECAAVNSRQDSA